MWSVKFTAINITAGSDKYSKKMMILLFFPGIILLIILFVISLINRLVRL